MYFAVLALNFVDNYCSDRSSRTTTRRLRVLAATSFGTSCGAVDPASISEAAELIFGELVANVARVCARYRLTSRSSRAARADSSRDRPRGSGYATAQDKRADLLAESGRGLRPIRRLGGEFNVEMVPGFGTHVSVGLPARQLAQ